MQKPCAIPAPCPQPTRRFDVTGPLPFDEDLTRTYELVPADTPLEAVYAVQRDALGARAVRLVDGRMVFTDPSDRAWAAGRWRVAPL